MNQLYTVLQEFTWQRFYHSQYITSHVYCVAEHPVVVEQAKSHPEPLTQAIEQIRAVRVLQSSSSLPLGPLPPPPLDPPPPLIELLHPGGHSGKFGMQNGLQE
ncbi:uncharacterized protein N7500_007271 [Penicillium coprophilum]|uniref:uncharacterized protein n=1 Tax=Penicillium coprophilum TaxID=36646 RepID=UPI0023918CEB|nr:uncharacterized protein N7500_007271 [Penicillium coprophilum]KAJ5165441.1 hypothetical protein N7500_007271 [Penicillium coprophilum]